MAETQTPRVEGTNPTDQGTKLAASSEANLEQYLIKLLDNETSSESIALKNLIIKRIALEGDVKPARIPAPLNITQIGGYINLMEQLNLSRLQERTLTSILGLPVQYDETALSKDLEISMLRRELDSLKKEIASLKQQSE